MAKIQAPKRSEAQWQKLYNAYLRQQSKFSEELSGNTYSTLSLAEFKGNYNSLWMGGVRQNITRKLVQRSARVSYKQSRVFATAIQNMKNEIINNQNATPAEIAILNEFNLLGGKIKDIRRNPEIIEVMSQYMKLKEATSFSEWIPTSPQ